MLSESTTDTTALAEVAQASSVVNLIWRYKWAISNADIDAAKKLRLTRVKKFWTRAGPVEIDLHGLHD